ncbi:MAG TPA: hypothetical protein VIJ82_27985 [Streptosporangiaceae bacterium]
MTAVLGDFLGPASEHLAAAVSFGDDLPYPAACGAIRELSRVISAMARYLGDLALPDGADQARPADTWLRMATATRLALRRSALRLQSAAGAVSRVPADETHPVVAHLSAAADQLAVSRDLLQGRLQPGRPAAPDGHAYWAAVASSPPVTAALLAEITGHARTLAPWAAQLSLAVSADSARLPLHDAARWLYAAAGTADAWQQHQELPPAARQQLHGIPVPVLPARHPPVTAETVPGLCAGIAATATRLRYAALAFAPHARTSPAANSLSWRRDAAAAAITTHASHLILTALAERASQIGAEPALRAQIGSAAAAAQRAWPAWRAVTHHWDIITTATRPDTILTPVAAEISDLILRAGRLAFASPRWTPASADAGHVRDPADLALAAGDITTITAAIHHAADAITLIAATDRQAVREAAHGSRLYIPTRLRSETCDTPYRYTHSPASWTWELLASYDTATQAATTLTAELDELAVLTSAPSQILAAPRRNSPPTRPGHGEQHAAPYVARTDIGIPQPGQLEKLLHSLRITEPAMLTRAQLADATAHDILAEAAAKTQRRQNPYYRIPEPLRPQANLRRHAR